MTHDEAGDPDAGPNTAPPVDAQTVALLIFRLGPVYYAVAPSSVREVVAAVEPTPVPGVPAFVRGVCNLAGRIVIVVDLASLLGGATEAPSAASRYVVMQSDGGAIAAPVDEVIGISDVARAALRTAGAVETDPAVERFVDADRQVTVLEVGRIFALAANRASEGSPWTS